MRISDWSSDVCSSDLHFEDGGIGRRPADAELFQLAHQAGFRIARRRLGEMLFRRDLVAVERIAGLQLGQPVVGRSEEHTSELQSLMRISYAVFCLKKKPPKNAQSLIRQLTMYTL